VGQLVADALGRVLERREGSAAAAALGAARLGWMADGVPASQWQVAGREAQFRTPDARNRPAGRAARALSRPVPLAPGARSDRRGTRTVIEAILDLVRRRAGEPASG